MGLMIILSIPAFIDKMEDVEQNQHRKSIIPLMKDQYLAKLQNHEAYLAFYEKYPNANELYKYDKRHNDAELDVGVINSNFDTELRLEMYYDDKRDFIDIDVYCDKLNEVTFEEFIIDGSSDQAPYPNYKPEPIPDFSKRVDGLHAIQFIKTVKCLD